MVASAHITYDALDPAMYAQQEQVGAAAADALKGTPMYEGYVRVAPRPEDFPRLLDKIGASMKKPFDFSEEVRGLKVPTMFVAADADMAPPSHYVEAFKLLDGGLRDGGWMGEGRPTGGHALAILPGLDPLQPRDIAALRDGDAVVPGRARRHGPPGRRGALGGSLGEKLVVRGVRAGKSAFVAGAAFPRGGVTQPSGRSIWRSIPVSRRKSPRRLHNGPRIGSG